MSRPVTVQVEATPNPRTLKFLTNINFMETGGRDYPTREQAASAPLAKRVFELPQVGGVYIGTHFLTVTKTDEGDWQTLSHEVIRTLLDHLGNELPVFGEDSGYTTHAVAADDVSRRIQEVLDEFVRPAVAQDGGDVVFHSFENGTVRLHMQGACSGCPSSTLTLRMGIQNMLMEQVPEVKEVVQI